MTTLYAILALLALVALVAAAYVSRPVGTPQKVSAIFLVAIGLALFVSISVFQLFSRL